MPCFRVCKNGFLKDYNGFGDLRKFWEEWDLRILVLYILFTQLYLHYYGQHRRKGTAWVLMTLNVWLLYLFSDLLATIALGKLSKVKVDKDDDPKQLVSNSKGKNGDANKNLELGPQALRCLWAPMILFYLGGPDTLTVLRVEENHLWVRHLVGLFTQGLRASYVLMVTWTRHWLSRLALMILIPGILKYGERVWVIRSRSVANYKGGFVQLDEPEIENFCKSWPKAKPVLRAYSWFHALRPHTSDFGCDTEKLGTMVPRFRTSANTGTLGDNSVSRETTVGDIFKLVEIELGLMYDMLFSKVGTLFTVSGIVLRFIYFSCIITVLVVFLVVERPPGHLEDDFPITVVLLAGAICLEIAGVLVQLVSDWAIIWACKHPTKFATPVIYVHKFLASQSNRWSSYMGQFSYLDYCTKYKPTVYNNMVECLFGTEKMLKRFSSTLSLFGKGKKVCSAQNMLSPVGPILRELIVTQLCDKSEKFAGGDTVQTSTEKVAGDDIVQTSTEIAASGDIMQTSTDIVPAGGDNVQTSTGKVAGVDTLEKKKVADVDVTLQTSRGEWTLTKYDCLPVFNWSIKLQFHQSIVVWHVATEVCYSEDYPKINSKDEMKLRAVKTVSDYMMYLLLICPSKFPFCKEYHDKFMQDYPAVKQFFGVGESTSSNGQPHKQHTKTRGRSNSHASSSSCTWNQPFRRRVKKENEGKNAVKITPGNNIQKLLGGLNEGESTGNITEGENAGNITPENSIQQLVRDLKQNPKRWDIMGNLWVEMMCCAASKCPIKNHVEELRHGGEFLTHVWLLLMHFGVPKKVERDASSLKDELDAGTTKGTEFILGFGGD